MLSLQTTPLWRRSHDSTQVLCNACALFFKMKGRPRPISLKTDVIKQRNRSKGKSTSKDRLGNSVVAISSAGSSINGASSSGGSGSKKARGNSTSRTREEGKSNGKSATGGSEMDDEELDYEESQLQAQQDATNGSNSRKARKVGAVPYPPQMQGYPNVVNPYPYPYPYQPPPPLQSQHPLAHSHPHQHHQPYPPPRERSRSSSTTRRAPSADGRTSYSAGQVRGVQGESSNSSSAMSNSASTSSSTDNRNPYPYPPPPPPPGAYQTPGGPPHEPYYPYYPGYPYPGQPYYPPPPPGTYLPHPSHYHGSIPTSSSIKHAQSDSRSQSPSGLPSSRSTNVNTAVDDSPRSSASPPHQNSTSTSTQSTVTSTSTIHPYPPPLAYYPQPHYPAYNHSPLSSTARGPDDTSNSSRPTSHQRRALLANDLERVTLAPINPHSRTGSVGGSDSDGGGSNVTRGRNPSRERIVLPSIGSVTPTALLSGTGSPLPLVAGGGVTLQPIQRHTALFESRFPPAGSTNLPPLASALGTSTLASSGTPFILTSTALDRSRQTDRSDFDELDEDLEDDPEALERSQRRDRTTRGDSVVSSNSAASASNSSEGQGRNDIMGDIASPEITSATLPWGISGTGAYGGSGTVGDERRGRSERRYGDDTTPHSIAEESYEKDTNNSNSNSNSKNGFGSGARDSSLGGRMVGVETGFEELRVVDRSRSTGGGNQQQNIASPRGAGSSSGGGNHHGDGTDSSRSRSSGGNNGQEERGRGGFSSSSRSNSGNGNGNGNSNGNGNRSGSTSRAISTSRNSNGGGVSQARSSSNSSSTGRLSSIDEVAKLKTRVNISRLSLFSSLYH